MGSYDALHSFRRSFYECLHRRADALFELSDAILAAGGAVPSPAHLSLQASHRRGWGSLYATLDRGRIDAESLRKALACHPLAFGDADATQNAARKGDTITILPATPRASPSWPDGLTSSSHNSTSSARAGPPRYAWSVSIRTKKRTR